MKPILPMHLTPAYTKKKAERLSPDNVIVWLHKVHDKQKTKWKILKKTGHAGKM